MLMALDGKHKIGLVYGTLPKSKENTPQHCSWMRNNITVSSWLLNSVSKKIFASVIYAADIWKELQDRCQPKNYP